MQNRNEVRIKKPILSLTKRQKIVITSIIITIGLLSTQSVNFFFLRSRFILGLGIVAYILTLWVLWEGISKLRAIILPILPTMFTWSVASFYFLLPVRWVTRLPVAIVFGLTFYLLLLAQNILHVSSTSRMIPLHRVAATAIFPITLVTVFFTNSVVYTLNLPFYWNGVLIFILSFPLILQIFWTHQMSSLTTQMVVYDFVISMILSEIAICLSFWAVAPGLFSLILTTAFFVCVGLIQELFRDHFSVKLFYEYIAWAACVIFLAMGLAAWSGL